MRCTVCNALLSAFESTRKHPDTNEYLDTCCTCTAYTKQPSVDNYSLMDAEDLNNMAIDTEDTTWYVDTED